MTLSPASPPSLWDVDPDNEFNWNDESLKRIYQEFERLVADYEVLI
jgi:NAD(P)H-quinone oxidoreductase subunit M